MVVQLDRVKMWQQEVRAISKVTQASSTSSEATTFPSEWLSVRTIVQTHILFVCFFFIICFFKTGFEM